MSKATHTKGPWSIGKIINGFIEICSPLDNASTCPVADIHVWNDAKAESKANARLIAAAPDLLEAARLTVQHFERSQASSLVRLRVGQCSGRLYGNFQGDDEHKCWTALNKAIAKATGEP